MARHGGSSHGAGFGHAARCGGEEASTDSVRIRKDDHRVQLDGPRCRCSALDAEAWKTVSVLDPKGHKIFEVSPKGKLRALGGSELFVESDEPDIADVPLSDLFTQFPEGTYTFVGTSPDGEKLKSTTTFSHVIPDGPTIVSAGTLDPAHATIAWNAVTTPAGVAIAGYEVVIEHDDFHFFDVKVPATTTNVTVPPQLLQPTTQYGFEVLAIDASGNQTITESSFTTQ